MRIAANARLPPTRLAVSCEGRAVSKAEFGWLPTSAVLGASASDAQEAAFAK